MVDFLWRSARCVPHRQQPASRTGPPPGASQPRRRQALGAAPMLSHQHARSSSLHAKSLCTLLLHHRSCLASVACPPVLATAHLKHPLCLTFLLASCHAPPVARRGVRQPLVLASSANEQLTTAFARARLPACCSWLTSAASGTAVSRRVILARFQPGRHSETAT